METLALGELRDVYPSWSIGWDGGALVALLHGGDVRLEAATVTGLARKLYAYQVAG
jgi:hypothetical protein